MNNTDAIRPFVDFERYKKAAGQLRSQVVHNAIWRISPSRRTARTFALAFLLATGAFWAIILQDPPKTIAADPSLVAGKSELWRYTASADLPEERWDAH